MPKHERRTAGGARLIPLLGPAFVAAVAYVDPGNVAANITAGARYGYLLVWVLVASNLAAMLVQYESAKLGLVTGKSLPALLGERLGRPARLAFWFQAEVVAAATDLAEVIGGAVALHLLFGLPLLPGGLIIGAVSTLLLLWQDEGRQRRFEMIVVALLLVITIGFLAGLVVSPPDPAGVASGLLPRFAGPDSVLVAASMLGATVMPHAVYLHSSLVNDHHDALPSRERLPQLLRATRIDIVWALGLAGLVNIGLLLVAASALHGVAGTDTIEGAHAAIAHALGPAVGTIFAIGLLASGLASTSVGAYAGSEIMAGLLHAKIPLLVRRLITLVPALIILALGAEPTWALVVSQVVLSFGIPFAIIPLMSLTRNRELMGDEADGTATRIASTLVAALIVGLNVVLLWLTLAPLLS
ncbi:Nramp family divalent metal transporter [Actinomyces culturomici]|uniref:Nramp family divalent metal transporter n=1 Tax=Actinomyces culturomici TaxID=1926276 RepID=UPI000E204BB5|nr:Nramp family divalent metal transporter [Actinomyces culturomici]